MKLLLLLPLAGLCLFACKTRPASPDQYTGRQIVFGQGGGFTGFYTHYYLLENGDLYRQQDPDTSMHHLKRVRKREYRDIFAQCDSLQKEQFSYQQAGNMTHFVEVRQNGDTLSASFAMQDSNVPRTVLLLYDQLMALTEEK